MIEVPTLPCRTQSSWPWWWTNLTFLKTPLLISFTVSCRHGSSNYRNNTSRWYNIKKYVRILSLKINFIEIKIKQALIINIRYSYYRIIFRSFLNFIIDCIPCCWFLGWDGRSNREMEAEENTTAFIMPETSPQANIRSSSLNRLFLYQIHNISFFSIDWFNYITNAIKILRGHDLLIILKLTVSIADLQYSIYYIGSKVNWLIYSIIKCIVYKKANIITR